MIAGSREMTMSWEFTDRLRLDFSQNNGMENVVLHSFVLNARSFRQSVFIKHAPFLSPFQ
jgi:hypothetical protein